MSVFPLRLVRQGRPYCKTVLQCFFPGAPTRAIPSAFCYNFPMSSTDFLTEEIFRRYGTVQRARGCFLYTKKGVRLTDMWQEGGRAILGWGGSSAFTMFKNALSRGSTGSFITEFDCRTQKAVSSLLCGERRVFFYSSRRSVLDAALSVCPDGTSFYRPWKGDGIDFSSIPAVVLEPPLPWTDDMYILALSPAVLEKNFLSDRGTKPNAPMQAAMARSIYNLVKALQERKESDWFMYDKILKGYFERKGPYLYPRVEEESYRKMVLHFLDCAVVISPVYSQPSIVPFGADLGVFTKLKNSPFTD